MHYAALRKHHVTIKTLLLDPRTDASKQNIYGKTPRDVVSIDTEKDILLRQELFAHCSLNLAVNPKAAKLKQKYPNGNIPKKIIVEAVELILRKATADQKKQRGDEALPIHAHLPTQADKNFVTQMLLFQLTIA